MSAADHLADFSTTDDALVLASVSSKAESDLLNDWLQSQRRAHPDTAVEVLRLPHSDPSPQLVDELAGKLNAAEDRTAVPVRVFWVPGGLPTRVEGRRPDLRARHLPAAGDPATGDPAQGSRRAPASSPASRPRSPNCASSGVRTRSARAQQDFARFVLRRAALAIERIELRLLGPAYKSPRLITDELMASSRFMKGLEEDPGRQCRDGRDDAQRACHRMEQVLRGPDSQPGPRHLQQGLRSPNRLRRSADRVDAPGPGGPPRGVALVAPLLSRRRDRAGGLAGEQVASGAHIRRDQPVVRVHGPADAPLGCDLPAAQARRSAVQVRAAPIRRLHRAEAFQPQLVDRGHPLAHRKDVAAQARSAQLRRRRLPRRAQ